MRITIILGPPYLPNPFPRLSYVANYEWWRKSDESMRKWPAVNHNLSHKIEVENNIVKIVVLK